MANQTQAQVMIDALVQSGIHHFFCAPGSRSTPLLLSLAEHPQACSSTHFDERALGFQALGYAKATKQTSALVVTSGTAVGNLLPAIMEAHLSHTPLLILTADRPIELLDCGANQACDQVKIFSNYVKAEFNLPAPSSNTPYTHITSLAAQAALLCQKSPAGVVHINCAFREPLTGSTLSIPLTTPHVEMPPLHIRSEDISHIAHELISAQKGVILVGSGFDVDPKTLTQLAEKLQWPIFADVLSSVRTRQGSHPCCIHHYDWLLKTLPFEADYLLQVGDRFVSKPLQEWIKQQTPSTYLHLSSHTNRSDPLHAQTHRLIAPVESCLQVLLSQLPENPSSSHLEEYREADNLCQSAKTTFFAQSPTLSELSLIEEVQSLCENDWALFLGNSMPIRDANTLFSPQNPCAPLLGNRGASGIDGNIATAVGIAKGLKQKTVALMGDLACLHDLNSLALIHELKDPFLLIVVNNGGGGLFSFLPVAQQKKELFEKFFAASHNWNLSQAAALFNLKYAQPQSQEELQNLLQNPKKPMLIEVCTHREENVEHHNTLFESVTQCLLQTSPV